MKSTNYFDEKKAEMLRRFAQQERDKTLRFKNKPDLYSAEIARLSRRNTFSSDSNGIHALQGGLQEKCEPEASKRGKSKSPSQKKGCNFVRSRRKETEQPDPISQGILMVISAASFRQTKEIHITQKKMIENLQHFHGIKISKPTLISRLKWLTERGYIRTRVWVRSWGKEQISKRSSYRLLSKAMSFLAGLAKFCRKLEKRFRRIRQAVKDWSWKLFGIKSLPKLDVVEHFTELGYRVIKECSATLENT